ncbi:MAG: hypothetical protein NT027_10085 [Proteobacteria bacterium]|nr:hypothetical protein [Pseudomonadota bacterium]
MKELFFAFLILGSAPCFSEEKCQFTLNCKSDKETFNLSFESPTKDCSEDNMEVFFTKDTVSKKLDLSKNWYLYTKHVSKGLNSVCNDSSRIEGFTAFRSAENRVLFFIKHSGRPSYDKVNAFLLDSKSGTVIDSMELGTTKNNYVAVFSHKNGFKARLIRDSLSLDNQVNCDCDAAFIDDWMQITVVKDKIKKSWIKK